jgi:hypothetical protein
MNAAVASMSVEENLRQSAPPGNRQLNKPWFMRRSRFIQM